MKCKKKITLQEDFDLQVWDVCWICALGLKEVKIGSFCEY